MTQEHPDRPSLERPDATEALTTLLIERILVIDGAMGTMIQGHGLDETGYRGERLAELGPATSGATATSSA